MVIDKDQNGILISVVILILQINLNRFSHFMVILNHQIVCQQKSNDFNHFIKLIIYLFLHFFINNQSNSIILILKNKQYLQYLTNPFHTFTISTSITVSGLSHQMASKYKHCYSNYVNHILNTSPSKISYSFSKGERFISPKKENDAPVDKILQNNIHPDVAKKYNVELPLQVNLSPKNVMNNYLQSSNQKKTTPNKKQTPNPKSQQKRSKSKSQKIQSSLLDKYLGSEPKRGQNSHVTFQRSPIPIKYSNQKHPKPRKEGLKASDLNSSNSGKRKVWEKGQDPFQKQRFPNNCLYTDPLYHYEPPQLPVDYPPHRLLPENTLFRDSYNQYLKYSPYYPSYVPQNEERLQQILLKSREKSSKKLNRSLSEKDRNRHQRIKTVTDVLKQMDHPSKNITIHGYYPIGTEIQPDGKYSLSTYKNVPSHSFGHPSDQKSVHKGVASNKKEKSKTKQAYLTRGASTTNLPKSYETYTPFSEFGYVQPFKY